jgi:hypothetical protein
LNQTNTSATALPPHPSHPVLSRHDARSFTVQDSLARCRSGDHFSTSTYSRLPQFFALNAMLANAAKAKSSPCADLSLFGDGNDGPVKLGRPHFKFASKARNKMRKNTEKFSGGR